MRSADNDDHVTLFREFDGRHEVPQDVAREGMRWMAAIAG
jgi:hypothetical protein